jgi:hypothetical protein
MTKEYDLQSIRQKTRDRATRTPLKTGVNSGTPEGYEAVPAPHVTSAVLLSNDTNSIWYGNLVWHQYTRSNQKIVLTTACTLDVIVSFPQVRSFTYLCRSRNLYAHKLNISVHVYRMFLFISKTIFQTIMKRKFKLLFVIWSG